MTTKGIDVSHYQGNIDFTKVKADGISFVFLKASQGTTFIDSMFNTNFTNATKAGLKVGAYHYGTFSTVAEAKLEAAWFLKVIAGKTFTYPVVLDIEENKKGASKAQLTDSCIAFIEVLENEGYFTMIYSGKSFYETSLDESRLKPYATWIARYGPTLGRTAGIWQYASDGKVNGIAGNVDMNTAYIDYSFISPKPKAVTSSPVAPVPSKPIPVQTPTPTPIVTPDPIPVPVPVPLITPSDTILSGVISSDKILSGIINTPVKQLYQVKVNGMVAITLSDLPVSIEIVKL